MARTFLGLSLAAAVTLAPLAAIQMYQLASGAATMMLSGLLNLPPLASSARRTARAGVAVAASAGTGPPTASKGVAALSTALLPLKVVATILKRTIFILASVALRLLSVASAAFRAAAAAAAALVAMCYAVAAAALQLATPLASEALDAWSASISAALSATLGGLRSLAAGAETELAKTIAAVPRGGLTWRGMT